jgi:predicted O-methyltransferase YrrM
MSSIPDPRGEKKASLASGDLRAYIEQNTKDPHPYLATIRASCMAHKWNFMLTTPDQAAFLYTQAKILGAKKILELGCFYGHSTLALAAGLAPGGQLITVEHNPKFAKTACDHLTHAGVIDRIEMIVGEAPKVMEGLLASHAKGSFDLVFVDADKRHSLVYWEAALDLVRIGGMIIFDNVLARGEILNDDPGVSGHAASMREFNARVLADDRIHSFIATIADGMLISIKT